MLKIKHELTAEIVNISASATSYNLFGDIYEVKRSSKYLSFITLNGEAETRVYDGDLVIKSYSCFMPDIVIKKDMIPKDYKIKNGTLTYTREAQLIRKSVKGKSIVFGKPYFWCNYSGEEFLDFKWEELHEGDVVTRTSKSFDTIPFDLLHKFNVISMSKSDRNLISRIKKERGGV